jgi:hypothetical protein
MKEDKAVILIKKIWRKDLEGEYGESIPDIEYLEAIKEAEQNRRAMTWYFFGFVTLSIYVIVDVLSPYL